MALRNLRPTTPGQRGASVPDFEEITRQKPEKSLVRPINSKGGRNATGRVTMRHQGGGHKRAYRLIDFVRNDKDGVPAKVAQIEYDPNRTANIALLHFADGEGIGTGSCAPFSTQTVRDTSQIELGPIGCWTR